MGFCNFSIPFYSYREPVTFKKSFKMTRVGGGIGQLANYRGGTFQNVTPTAAHTDPYLGLMTQYILQLTSIAKFLVFVKVSATVNKPL